MNKYEVDDFHVNKYGYLRIKRLCESGYQTMDCPFTFTFINGESFEDSGFESKACGKWCPLFGEVEESTVCQPLHQRDIVYGMNTSIIPPSIRGKAAIGEYRIKSISLCHKTIWCRVKDAEANKEE
jgi:hypothetical protein